MSTTFTNFVHSLTVQSDVKPPQFKATPGCTARSAPIVYDYPAGTDDRELLRPEMSEITQLLQAAECGDPRAANELLPLVYDELRTLAALKLAQEKPGQTLQPTALVHEAYLRLIGPANAA